MGEPRQIIADKERKKASDQCREKRNEEGTQKAH